MADKEYIERETAEKELMYAMVGTGYQSRAIDAIKFMPTADAVEVRHGEWVEQLDGTHYCSECGHDATYTYDGTEICGIGCPFCYAKMDGKGKASRNMKNGKDDDK